MSVRLEWVGAADAELELLDREEHDHDDEVAPGQVMLRIGHPEGIVLIGTPAEVVGLLARAAALVGKGWHG